MTASWPKVVSIRADLPFLDTLARGLLARAGDDPMKLPETTVLLPTRRACRSLQEAFLRASGGRALLLPRLLPLGDVESEELDFAEAEETAALGERAAELPPPFPPLARQLHLARLIRAWRRSPTLAEAPPPSEDQSVRLAAELARLLDQVETEGLDFASLRELVPEDYSRHWQLTLSFLAILTDHWPKVEAIEGKIGPALRRRLLLEAQAAWWRSRPPKGPIVIAGSTGSQPATASLISVVAALPDGLVVLPGLDRVASEETWSAVVEEPHHPQHGLARLLAKLGIGRDRVDDWPESAAPKDSPRALRKAVVEQALKPAAVPFGWDGARGKSTRAAVAEAFGGVTRIDCASPGEEALTIALILRRALEQPECRAALVTPDRGLARRVAAELARWRIAVDDSAGKPLAETPPGSFLRLTAELAASRLAPLPLLAALKHPLAAGGETPVRFRQQVRLLEIAALRGARPAPGFPGLKRALRESGDQKPRAGWLSRFEGMAAPFVKLLGRRRLLPLAELLRAHLAFAEALAASDEETGSARLWRGEAGDAAVRFLQELTEAAGGALPIAGARYPELLDSLMAGRVVRPRYGAHPRLSIWGPLEARLQQVEVMVLGSLNEGTGPTAGDPGPWLSRPMRAAFGLPPLERRIGQAAHDFAQAMSAPKVFLTRARRVEGTPTVPSRWLLRLDALLAGLGLGELLRPRAANELAWAEALDRPSEVSPMAPPEPRPPLAARPRQLSVTEVETWLRNPYALYARKILKLRELDPIDADPGAADRGTLVHRALEAFVKAYPRALPDDVAAALIALGEKVFAPLQARPGAHAFWWPRFQRAAAWIAEAERRRRSHADQVIAEALGTLTFGSKGGDFTITAKADRIERLRDGTLAILDYKTGTLPKTFDIEVGRAAQLPLEAAIAEAGGFAGVKPAEVSALLHWRLTGGDPPGEERALPAVPEVEPQVALAGLKHLVARFDNEATPYRAAPYLRFDPYAQLARVKEWTGENES